MYSHFPSSHHFDYDLGSFSCVPRSFLWREAGELRSKAEDERVSRHQGLWEYSGNDHKVGIRENMIFLWQ